MTKSFQTLLLVFLALPGAFSLAAPGRTSDCAANYAQLEHSLETNGRRSRGMVFPDVELQRHAELAKTTLDTHQDELSKKYQWQGFRQSLEPRLAARLTEELRRQQRFLPEFGARERQELMTKLLFEVSEEVNQQYQLVEAEARRERVYEKISERVEAGDFTYRTLNDDNFAKLVRDVLHDQLHGRLFIDLKADEQKALVDAAYNETVLRFNAVNKEVDERLVLLGGHAKLSAPTLKRLVMQELQMALRKRQKNSIGELTADEKAHVLDELDSEVYARLAWLDDAFQGMASRLGTPWRQWVRMYQDQMKGAILETLGDRLLAENKAFSDLSEKQRDNLVDEVAGQVLSPYQSKPTLAVIGGGIGLPIAVGMIGGSFLPAKLAAGYAVLTGTITGPLSSYWNYWFGGVTKPLVSPKSITTWRANGQSGYGPTPLQREFARIGATATGLTDQFKDGRNITKDSLIPLLDALNDAAFHAKSQPSAEWLAAASILQHSLSFPEVQMNAIDSFKIYLKLKDRFASNDAYNSIRQKIQDLAARWGENPNQALETLQRVLNPNLWTEFPAEAEVSEAGDRDLGRILSRGKGAQADEQTRYVALAALYFQSKYSVSALSPLTVAEFRADYQTWLADPANFEKAKAEITRHAVDFGVSPEAAIAQLDRLCHQSPADAVKPDAILQMLQGEHPAPKP